MSSISPVATEKLASLVAAKGGSMIDAPVSGGEIGAINAQLSIMCGGDEAAFNRVKPILAAMGNPEKIVYIGRSGAGQICKVCNQIAIGGALAGVSRRRPGSTPRACARRCSAASRRAACSRCTASGC
jgi:2-hydroxy-3-oxopropionate reductase